MAHTTCNYFDTLQNCRFIVGMACFALYFDEKCFKTASKNYGRRRKRWQREHQKRNRFILAKKTLHMYNAFFCSFLSRRCTTTAWKCLISRFVEDGNIRQHFFFFPELWYSPSEFNSKKICQHLTNYTRWNKRDKVSGSANSLFKWRFRSRRRCCYLSSLLYLDGRVASSSLTCRKSFKNSRCFFVTEIGCVWAFQNLLSSIMAVNCTAGPAIEQDEASFAWEIRMWPIPSQLNVTSYMLTYTEW